MDKNTLVFNMLLWWTKLEAQLSIFDGFLRFAQQVMQVVALNAGLVHTAVVIQNQGATRC